MNLLDTGMKWNLDFWTEVSKIKFLNTSGDKRTKTNGILLVVTYHPLLKDFAKVVNRHLHLLYMNDEV